MASKCKSCSAPLVWVETLATEKRPGRKLPLDADPANPHKALRVPDGNVVPERIKGTAELLRSGDGTPIVRVLPNTARPDGGAFRSHFASCENAASHRKARA